MANDNTMSPVVHFEMGYNDRERMVKFYQSAFGWKTQSMGPEMGNYVTAQTGPTGEDRIPKEPGFINGGFYAKTDSPDSHAPSIVISVNDINASIQAVKDAGGTIKGGMQPGGTHTMEPTMIPGVGLWISCSDTEGNRFSILQPKT